jgi:hypothetical protein
MSNVGGDEIARRKLPSLGNAREIAGDTGYYSGPQNPIMRARCQGQHRNEAERARRGTCGRAEAWAEEVTGIPLGHGRTELDFRIRCCVHVVAWDNCRLAARLLKFACHFTRASS